jgi:hypothetical protein
MMAVLFIIGRGDDDYSVIDLLFDIEQLPDQRPNYEIAAENGLILSECGFDDIQWSNASLAGDVETYKVFLKQFEEAAIAMSISEVMMRQYQERTFEPSAEILKPFPGHHSGQLNWNEAVKLVTMARKKQKTEDGSNIIRRAVLSSSKGEGKGKKRDIKSHGKAVTGNHQ